MRVEACDIDPDCKEVVRSNDEMYKDLATVCMHAITLGIFLYTILISLVLLPFGREMHEQIMDNTTTNEKIRKKWNAK